MKKLDIKLSDKVVLYDTDLRNVFGYRAAWKLQAMGHPDTHVLDGGYSTWKKPKGKVIENLPVETAIKKIA